MKRARTPAATAAPTSALPEPIDPITTVGTVRGRRREKIIAPRLSVQRDPRATGYLDDASDVLDGDAGFVCREVLERP